MWGSSSSMLNYVCKDHGKYIKLVRKSSTYFDKCSKWEQDKSDFSFWVVKSGRRNNTFYTYSMEVCVRSYTWKSVSGPTHGSLCPVLHMEVCVWSYTWKSVSGPTHGSLYHVLHIEVCILSYTWKSVSGPTHGSLHAVLQWRYVCCPTHGSIYSVLHMEVCVLSYTWKSVSCPTHGSLWITSFIL